MHTDMVSTAGAQGFIEVPLPTVEDSTGKISLRNSVIAVRGPSAGSPIACTRALHRWRYHSRNSHVGRSYFLASLEGDTQYINRGKRRLFCRVRFVVEKRCRQHS